LSVQKCSGSCERSPRFPSSSVITLAVRAFACHPSTSSCLIASEPRRRFSGWLPDSVVSWGPACNHPANEQWILSSPEGRASTRARPSTEVARNPGVVRSYSPLAPPPTGMGFPPPESPTPRARRRTEEGERGREHQHPCAVPWSGLGGIRPSRQNQQRCPPVGGAQHAPQARGERIARMPLDFSFRIRGVKHRSGTQVSAATGRVVRPDFRLRCVQPVFGAG